MPKQVNRHPGIKSLPTGKWQARVFHERGEQSKTFTRLEDAKTWQRNLKNDLTRCPATITYKKGTWEATLLTDTGTITKKFLTLDEATTWLTRGEAQVRLGSWVDPDTLNKTFNEYLDVWLNHKTSISGKTLATYKSQLTNHIKPTFGNLQLRAITTTKIKDWVTDLTNRQIGPTTTKQAYRLLRQILESALADALITRNPAIGIKLPKIQRKRAQGLTPEQVNALAAECGKYGYLILFLAGTGLRINEALALQLRDIDFENKTITVARSWTSDSTGKRILGSTKTRKSRIVPLNDSLIALLSNQLPSAQSTDYVFTGHFGEALDYGYFRRAYFAPAADRLGYRGVTIHWLRHTFASMLIRLGAPITTVSSLLGHDSVKMTLDTYGHYYESDSPSWMGLLAEHMCS